MCAYACFRDIIPHDVVVALLTAVHFMATGDTKSKSLLFLHNCLHIVIMINCGNTFGNTLLKHLCIMHYKGQFTFRI